MSWFAQLPVLLLLLLLLLLREVRHAAAAAFVPLVASLKNTIRGCIHSYAHADMSPRETAGGDQLARLVHRGVGGSLRVMVQRARVIVGATSYYHSTIHI